MSHRKQSTYRKKNTCPSQYISMSFLVFFGFVQYKPLFPLPSPCIFDRFKSQERNNTIQHYQSLLSTKQREYQQSLENVNKCQSQQFTEQQHRVELVNTFCSTRLSASLSEILPYLICFMLSSNNNSTTTSLRYMFSFFFAVAAVGGRGSVSGAADGAGPQHASDRAR